MFEEVVRRMGANADLVVPGIAQLFVSKYLERIADHATNIAEEVIKETKERKAS